MDIIDELIRSKKRKTLCISVSRDAKVCARAPEKMPLDMVRKFVAEKQHWIEQKKAEALKKISQTKPKQFIEGEEFLFKGQKYPLKFTSDAPAPIYFNNAFIIAENYQSKAQRLMQGWYEIKAEQIISERVKVYAEAFNITVRKIRVVDTKSQWGSCSADGNLSFCWRLVMCPTRIIDYVVAHELAHRFEMNHSKRFWNIVEKMRPDYKEQKKWLKENSHFLKI